MRSILIWSTLKLVTSLQVYDCSSTETKITEISLKEVKQCDEIPNNYDQGSSTEIQVVKKIDIHYFKATLCYIRVSLSTMYCGHDSIYSYSYSSGKKLMYEKLIKITDEECEKLYTSKIAIIKLDNNIELKIDLEQTDTKTGSSILKGSQNQDTSCTGENFNLNNQFYKNTLLFSDYKVLVTKVTAHIDLTHNKITIDNKLICASDKTSIFDPELGLYTWQSKDLPSSKCDLFREIIRSTGKIYKPQANKEEYQDILILEDKKRSRQAALLLGDNKIICDTIGSTTQFDSIYAIVIDKKNNPANVKLIEAESTSRIENLEAKIAFTYVSSEMRSEEAFSKITNALCETNRLRIQESIKSFAEQGTGLGGNQEGTVIIKAGSVAYIFACSPIEAKLRTEDMISCTNEIPITINNTTRAYADPVSLVIMKNSTKTFCSTISPVKWAIKNKDETEWYCSTPKITRCTEPETLDPMILKKNPYQLKTSALNLDLYDKDQMKAMERFLQIDSARKSLISEFAYEMTIDPDKSTGRLIFESLSRADNEKLRELLLPHTFKVICDLWEKAKNWVLTMIILKIIFNFIMLLLRIRTLIIAEGKISWRLLAAVNRQIFESFINMVVNKNCPCSQNNSQTCYCNDVKKLEALIRKMLTEKDSMAYYHDKAKEFYYTGPPDIFSHTKI